MVRMLAIHGSARKMGNSRTLLDELITAVTLAHDDVEVERVSAYEAGVDPCIACGACEEDQVGCVREGDNWHTIEASLRAADVLVMAAPVYFMGLPAPVKAMIDRLQALWWYRQRGGKVATNKGSFRRAGLILTAAGEGTTFTPSRRMAIAAFNTLGFELAGVVLGDGLEGPGEAQGRADLLGAARQLGEDLVGE